MVPNARHGKRAEHRDQRTLRRATALIFLTVALALPRFAHTTPDSTYYVTLVEYFRGVAPRAELHTPFAFRWLVPWTAAWLPGLAPARAIALCSIVALLGAYGCFDRMLRILLPDEAMRWRAMLILVVSFPTINYGSAVLTDSAGFLVLAGGAWALLARRFFCLGLTLVAGAWVRESTALMLPALWAFIALEKDRRGLLPACGVTVAALLAAIAVRWWFADLPAYFWFPNTNRFTANALRPVSWATLGLTAVPVGTLALLGLRHWSSFPARTRHFMVATALPGMALLGYSVVAAFMSGRFFWPLYLALVPLASGARNIIGLPGAASEAASPSSPPPPAA